MQTYLVIQLQQPNYGEIYIKIKHFPLNSMHYENGVRKRVATLSRPKYLLINLYIIYINL